MVKIELKNGDIIKGHIEKETDNIIKIRISKNEVLTFNKRLIKNMVRGV